MRYKIRLVDKVDAYNFYRGNLLKVPHGRQLPSPQRNGRMFVAHVNVRRGIITVSSRKPVDWRRIVLLTIWGALWAAVLLMLCLGGGQ